MVPRPAAHPTAGLLRPFWESAGLPTERFLYYEFQARRYAAITEFLRRYAPWEGRRVLDLGAGVGSLAVVLRAELGGEYDIAEFLAPTELHAEALTRGGVAHSFLCDLSNPRGLDGLPSGYDAVLLVEVLEHLLVNPLLLFRAVHDRLANGGLFFLTTPNLARLPNRIRLLMGRSIKENGRFPWDGSPVYGHVIEYTLDELDRLMAAESFQRDHAVVVQQIPTVLPSTRQRWGVRVLNTSVARRLRWGDDLLVAYRKIPRPPDGRPPVALDAAGRV